MESQHAHGKFFGIVQLRATDFVDDPGTSGAWRNLSAQVYGATLGAGRGVGEDAERKCVLSSSAMTTTVMSPFSHACEA